MILRTLLGLWTSVARPMGDHLWQSTLFLAIAAILALALRENQARVRYWLWLSASVKFLIPFSLLIALGSHLARPRVGTPAQVVMYSAVEDFSQPFAGQQMPVIFHSAPVAASATLLHLLPAFMVAVWFIGVVIVLLRWGVGWVRISLMVRRAAFVGEGPELDALRRLESSLGVRVPIRMVLSPDWMEPGIFGIFRPVLIWPEGISKHLDDRHVEAILAHEVCHARRHDNLTAVLNMLVQVIFWFHPLVWWMGARLEEERERACDEEVSLLCNQPHVYAESILRVCKFCSESPLACVSGITGADLKKRIVQIMTERVARKLDLRRKLLLLTATAAVVVAPLALGLARMPVMFGQILKASGPRPSFEVASIHLWKRPAPSPETVGGEQVIHQQTVKFSPRNGVGQTSDRVHIIAPLGVLIAQAYGLPPGSDGRGDGRIVEGPDWMTQDDEQYDIQAKIDDQEFAEIQRMTAEQQRERVNLMKQSLLADRFKLKVHFETRELPAYALVVAKGGPKLTPAKEGESTKLSSTRQGQTTQMSVTGATLALFAGSPLLSGGTGSRTVLDQTGLTGRYDFTLKWGVNSALVGQEPSDEPALFTAIQEQLGLKLLPTKGAVEVIVIDHIEKPSVDGAEVRDASLKPVAIAQETLPALPDVRITNAVAAAPSFEVASVRMVDAQTAEKLQRDASMSTYPTSHFFLHNAPLDFLVGVAFGIDEAYIQKDAGWMDSQLYDIDARVGGEKPLTEEEMRPLLQELLLRRFHLTAHRTSKFVSGLELIVAKGGPKVKVMRAGEETHAQILPNRLDAQAVSTKMLASFLMRPAGQPVVDKTGLTGSYDIRLDFAPPNDPNSPLPSIFTAIEEQLGLRLQPAKVPINFLVIDHADRVPTEN